MVKLPLFSLQHLGSCLKAKPNLNSHVSEVSWDYLWTICTLSRFVQDQRGSKAAHKSGFKTMAVDHTTSRSCGFPI